MSTINTAIISSHIISFEELFRKQLETQEVEMREQLMVQEADIHQLKKQKSINDKLVEELRPLCKELPLDALDPVTMEPYDMAMVFRCGHSINIKTMVNFAKAQKLYREDPMACSSCRVETSINKTYPCFSLDNCVNHIKEINKIFIKNARSE